MSRMTHGMTETGTYRSWAMMKSRCSNPLDSRYVDYGARGIRVCERWIKFEAFLEDMGPRPIGTTLERIDNDGNYEPRNCRWATPKEQANHRRNNRLVTYKGETLTMAQWCDRLKLSRSMVKGRFAAGDWTIEEIFETPPLSYAERGILGGNANHPQPSPRTHCRRGHKFRPRNIVFKGGHRRCRICWENWRNKR